MLYSCLLFSLKKHIFVSENQGHDGKRTATYNQLKTGSAETGNPLTLSHKLQCRYAK